MVIIHRRKQVVYCYNTTVENQKVTELAEQVTGLETAWPSLKRNNKMGETEATLPNMSLQGKYQQPMKCSQSET